MMSKGYPLRRRSGFTVIELLVVMAIIALLVSVSAGGYMLVLRTQRGKNTDALILKLNQALEQQKQAFIQQVKAGEVPDYYMAAAGGDRPKAISRWLNVGGRPIPDPSNPIAMIAEPPLLKQEFPEAYFMAWWYNARTRRTLAAAGFTAVPASNASESSACLLLALSIARGGQVFNADTGLESGVVGSTRPNNIEVKDLRDAWADPLRFQWVLNPQGELLAVISSGNN